MSLPILIRDLIPDDLAGSDIDDPVAPVKMNHAKREPSPQRETKARRDDSTSKFLKALLNSRDLSRRFTADDVLGLASRALDDLD
jgi:hypothetical protein